MPRRTNPLALPAPQPRSSALLAGVTLGLTLLVLAAASLTFLLETKRALLIPPATSLGTTDSSATPFPISVDPDRQLINEDPAVEQFYRTTLAQQDTVPATGWQGALTAHLLHYDWFQQLASPVSRVVVIWPGERKEEAVDSIGDILRWDTSERTTFMELVEATDLPLTEGMYYPGRYITHRYATPADIHRVISEQFHQDVTSRYTNDVAAQVPLSDALIIASLIEREASNFTNMREVSGVIWNRLFIDMPLQLDASLQYIRGSDPTEPAWWPRVRPADKFLASPYNTYEHAGLPPGPIANPSLAAIVAALNPIETDCLYYFHTDAGEYVCTPTYEEHVEELRIRYGRGS